MSLAVQRFLAALVVDSRLFDDFRADSLSCATSFGLDSTDARIAAGTSVPQMAVFRDVVQGTRSIQFRSWFAGLAGALDERAWAHLLGEFHNSVSIRSGRQFADAALFAQWLGARHPQSRAQDLVAHDLALLVASGALRSIRSPAADGNRCRPLVEYRDSTFELRADAVPFALWTELGASPVFGDEALQRSDSASGQPAFFYLAHGDRAADADCDLTISELDAPTYSLVAGAFLPPWEQPNRKERRRITVPEGAAVEALLDAQLLNACHEACQD